jgi:protein-tyrosine-phosphatase
MTDNRLIDELSTEVQRPLRPALASLSTEFQGIFDDDTIEHFLVDSYQRLAAKSKTGSFLGVLSERFARERLQAMTRTRDASPSRPGVLFLCVHNAGRSQMAAGWLRNIAGDRVDVFTGGSEPGDELNAVVVEAMAEVGIDIRQEFPKPWTDEVVRAVDMVISMGCGDICPIYPGKNYVDWDLADPEGMTINQVRLVRENLKSLVEDLVGTFTSREPATASPDLRSRGNGIPL